jgi:hypothetical protein
VVSAAVFKEKPLAQLAQICDASKMHAAPTAAVPFAAHVQLFGIHVVLSAVGCNPGLQTAHTACPPDGHAEQPTAAVPSLQLQMLTFDLEKEMLSSDMSPVKLAPLVPLAKAHCVLRKVHRSF